MSCQCSANSLDSCVSVKSLTEVSASCDGRTNKLTALRATPEITSGWTNVARARIPLKELQKSRDRSEAGGILLGAGETGSSKCTNLPSSFSWINANKGEENYSNPKQNTVEVGDRNQQACGDCWAQAISSVLGDRYALTNKMRAPKLSAAWLTACGNTYYNDNISDTDNAANCQCGGQVGDSIAWIADNGIPLDNCWPFTDSNIMQNMDSATDSTPCDCSDMKDWKDATSKLNCYNPCENFDGKFKVKKTSSGDADYKLLVETSNNGILKAETIEMIKSEIYAYGPVVTAFSVPSDFETWWSSNSKYDVYKPQQNFTSIGWHAVSITGFGIDSDGVEYWEVRNSWGLTHGTSNETKVGWFRIAISVQNGEENAYAETGIDIPQNGDTDGAEGGCWALYPDDLDNVVGSDGTKYTDSDAYNNSKVIQAKSLGCCNSGKCWDPVISPESDDPNFSWSLFWWIVGSLLVVILIVVIILIILRKRR